jgi:hypothetical protein
MSAAVLAFHDQGRAPAAQHQKRSTTANVDDGRPAQIFLSEVDGTKVSIGVVWRLRCHSMRPSDNHEPNAEVRQLDPASAADAITHPIPMSSKRIGTTTPATK